MLPPKIKRLSKAVVLPFLLLLLGKVKAGNFVLPTCTEVTAESSYCSVAGITESTFCIYDSDVPSDGTPETIYAATSSACTIKDGLKSALADPPDYLIYKQKSGAGNEKIFTEGFGTSKDDQHVVFKATAASKVAPQNDIYVYDSSNKNLVACNNEYLCKITTTAGLYYSANTRSVIRCDGKACAPEVYVGVYYLASKIYRCTGSSTVVCVEGDKVDYNASFDNASHGGKFALNVNDIVYGLSAWKNVLNIAATTTTYRIISKDLADPLFGLNLAADGKVLAKITKEYAIKVDTIQSGYYVNGDKTDMTDALIYCSADNDITKCSAVAANPGYYAVGSATGSAESYIACDGSTCTENDFDHYDYCGNAFAIPNCDQTTDSESVCRTDAADGEICQSDQKFYESGVGTCREYIDYTYQSALQFFNARYKRVLQPKTVAGAYKCTVEAGTGALSACAAFNNELPACTQVASSTTACLTGAPDDTYCVDDSGVQKIIYKTKSNECKAVDGVDAIKDGDKAYYYFDKEFKRIEEVDQNSAIYATYLCQSKNDWDRKRGGYEIRCAKQDGAAIGNMVRTPTSVEMCTALGKSVPLVLASRSTYSSLTGVTSGEFAGVTETSFTLKSTSNSITKIDTSATVTGLPACKQEGGGTRRRKRALAEGACKNAVGDAEVPYCIDSNIVYVKGTGTCSKITSASYHVIEFFDEAGDRVADVDATKTIAYAYKCAYDDSGDKMATACALVQGHVIVGDYVVTCHGQGGDTCTVQSKSSTGDCSSGMGTVKSGGSYLCFPGAEVALPTEDGVSYLAFQDTNTFNQNYGQGADADMNVLLELGYVSGTPTLTYAVSTTTYSESNSAVYFVNPVDPSVAGGKPLIGMTSDGSKVATLSVPPVSGISDENPVKYYVDGANAKNIIVCRYGANCQSQDIVTSMEAGATAFYINAGKAGDVIKCDKSAGKCVANGNDYGAGNVYYFVDGSDTSKKSVIKCVAGGCTTIKNVVGGFFLSGGNKEHVKCPGTTANPTCSAIAADPTPAASITLSSETFQFSGEITAAKEGYLKLSTADAGTLFGGTEGIVKVTASSIVKVNVAKGFYRSLGVDTGLSEALIQCKDATLANCAVVDGVSGYYTYPEGDGAVIRCAGTACTEYDYSDRTSCDGTPLPTCTTNGAADNVCSGAAADDNNATHCIGTDGKIYKNNVSNGGNTKSCEAITGTGTGEELFSFKDDGKAVATLDGTSAATVVTTYLCQVSATVISSCVLVGNQLPTSAGAGAAACFTSSTNDQVSVMDGALFITYGTNDNCKALTGTAKSYHYFDSTYKKVESESEASYIYYCDSVGAGDALTGCKPVGKAYVGDVVKDHDTAKMCLSSSVDDAVTIGDTSDRYLALNSGFPDAPANVHITTTGSIVKMNDAASDTGLPECSTNSPANAGANCGVSSRTNLAYCINSASGGNNAIYKNGQSASCAAITGTGGDKNSMKYFVDDGTNAATAVTEVSSFTTKPAKISYAYKCVIGAGSGDQAATSCARVFGCSIESTHNYVVCCNNLKGEDCVIEGKSSCEAGAEGMLITTGNVCFGSKATALPTDDEAVVVKAFYTSQYSKYYSKYGVIFLEVRKNTVVLAASASIKKGYYVNQNTTTLKNALIYCATATDLSSCRVMDGVAGGYFVSALANDYVVRCDNSACKEEKINNITCGYENLLPECESTEAEGVCRDGAATNTYCVKEGVIYKNVVSGNTKSCTALTVDENNDNDKAGKFFFDDAHAKTTSGVSYYQCSVSGTAISNCSPQRIRLPDCASSIRADQVCRVGATSGQVCMLSGKLYRTGSNTCEQVKGIQKSYLYFTSTFTKATDVASAKIAVYCSGGGSGTTEGNLTSCDYKAELAGGVVKTSSGPEMCTSEDDKERLKVGDTTTAYKVVSVKNAAFPGVNTATSIKVKVTGTEGLVSGIVKMEEGAALQSCNNNLSATALCRNTNGENVAYCLKGSVIYRSTSDGTCVKLTDRDTDANALIFFDRQFAKANPDTGDAVYYAYQCEFEAGSAAVRDVTRCEFAQGVVKTTQKTVTCTGWKNDACKVVAHAAGPSCSNGVGGINNDATGICFGSGKVAFPVDGYKFVAFTTGDINRHYGVEKGNIVVLKMTTASALKTTYEALGDEEVYLIDQANPANADGKKPLIRCSPDAEPRCVAVASQTKNKVVGASADVVDAGKKNAYYIDGAYPFHNYLITCTQAVDTLGVVANGSCTSAEVTHASLDTVFYVDSATPGQLITCDQEANPVGYENLPTCEVTSPGNSNVCITGASAGEYCVRKGVLYVTGSNPKCGKVFICRSTASPFALYSSGSSTADEKIIKCDGEEGVTCAYLPDVTCGTTTEPTHNGKILIDSGSFKVCAAGEKKQISKASMGYWMMSQTEARDVFKGVTTDLLIENNHRNILSMVAVTPDYGYYMNVGDDATTNSVIQCAGNGECSGVAVTDVHCDSDRARLPVCTNIDPTKPCVAGGASAVGTHCVKNGKIYRTLDATNEKCREIQSLEVCEKTNADEKCMVDASANDLCVKDGVTYITVGSSACKPVSELTACASTATDSKCVEQAEVNDICLASDGKVYATTGESSCAVAATPLDALKEVKLYFGADHKFTDSGVSDNVKSVYRCKHRRGVLSSCEKSVQTPGGLVYSQTTGKPKSISMCVNSPDDAVSIGLGTPGYLSIYNEKVDAFPGASLPGTTTINVDVNHPYLVKDMDGLPACDVMVNGKACKYNGIEVRYCLSEGVVYESGLGTCEKKSGTAGKYSFLYLDSRGKAIDEANVSPLADLTLVYKCEYGTDGKAERCMMVRGYVLRNNYLIQCNGWSACTVSHVNAQGKDCTDAAEGTIMGNGKAICFYLYKDANNDEIYAEEKLPTTGTRYVMFEAAQANAVYGQNKGDVVVLSLTSDSVVVVSAGTGIARGFHQNIKVIGSLDNALIYCAQEGQLSSCGVVNGLNGFYLNYDSDRDTKEVIKCEEKLGCRKLPVTKTSCTAGDVGAVIKSGGKIMMCTTDAGGKVELGLSEANLNYLSVSPVNACFPGVIEENKSAVKVGADGSVTLLEPGVHLNEKVKGVVKNAIYTCTTKSVTTTCEVQDANLGYYKNAGTRHAEDTFIACSVNGCAGIAVDGQGECNANSVGKLIGASPSLCLLYNDDTGTEYNAALTGEDAVGYMVGYGVGNIFGIEENRYAFVNVNASSVQMSTEYQKYVYIKSDHLDEQGSSGCPAKEEELNEFMLEDDNIYGVYTLNCVDSQEKDNLCPGSESTTDTAGADE